MSRTPIQVKLFIQEEAKKYDGVIFDNARMKGAMIGQLNKVCGSNWERKQTLKYLFGKLSSKELTGAEWMALSRWIGTVQVGNAWVPQEDLYQEANDIVDEIAGVYRPRVEPYKFD